jgi:hypothetical protein
MFIAHQHCASMETIVADKLNNIFISEILADNAGSAAIDTDGDGSIKKSDEFIELQNASSTSVSLDGFEVWSEKNGLLFTFGASDTIAAGGTATIVGNYTGTPPAGYYDAGINENGNFIPDGENSKFDTIFLVNTNTGEYITLSYGDPAETPTLPTSFPGTTQLGAGESINSNAPNGTAFARDTNGDLVETTPTPNTPNIACFLKGTTILTENGAVLVENLEPGSRVLTKDSGYAKLLGIGRFSPSAFEVRRNPSLVPIVFPKGCIDNDRDLLMSASHRVLIEDTKAELLFGNAEVLTSARSFVGYRGVHVACAQIPLTYFHLLFEHHEIIRADSAWTESLFLADLGLRIVNQTDSWNFLGGLQLTAIRHARTARLVLKRYEATLLLTDRKASTGFAALAA